MDINCMISSTPSVIPPASISASVIIYTINPTTRQQGTMIQNMASEPSVLYAFAFSPVSGIVISVSFAITLVKYKKFFISTLFLMCHFYKYIFQ